MAHPDRYVRLLLPTHPNASHSGQVGKHVVVEERAVPRMDRVCGVARRWSVRHAPTQAMRLVILTLPGWEVGGREGRYLCSCGLATAGHPCDHVRAVVATLPAEPPEAA